MRYATSNQPVRHFVWDKFASPQPDWCVPPPGRAWEAFYDNDCERGKRTARKLTEWSEVVMEKMNSLEMVRHCHREFKLVCQPDRIMWGGGLQVIAPGGHLTTHLDGCLHPQARNFRRAVQMVCFCHREWEPEWGGQFYFAHSDGNPALLYDPVPGRLIVWEQTDLAYHGVMPVNGEVERVSVASSLLAPARETDTRLKALFMPNRG